VSFLGHREIFPSDGGASLAPAPANPAVAVKATMLGRFHGDPADRLIVAIAILESAVLVTKDQQVRKYEAIATIC